MRFKNIETLLDWAFQMSETEIINSAQYGERQDRNFSSLTMDERHKQAIDILAKVSRLDKPDIACITAKHTLGRGAVHDAAYLLPNMPRPMQLALVRRWAGDTRQSQREIAEMCGCSRKTVNLRESESTKILNSHYWHGCDMLEIQLLDLLKERLICA